MMIPIDVSAFVKDIEKRIDTKRKEGHMPYAIVLNPRMVRNLIMHPDLESYIKYSPPQIITSQVLASAFGLEEVFGSSGIDLLEWELVARL